MNWQKRSIEGEKTKTFNQLPNRKNMFAAQVSPNKATRKEYNDQNKYSEFIPINKTFRKVQVLLLAKEKALLHWDMKYSTFSDKTRIIGLTDGRVDIRTALDEAKLKYRDLLDKDDTESFNLYLHQGRHAMIHNKPEKALGYLNQAADIQMNNNVRIERGKCLLKLRLYEEACQDAEKILKLEPKNDMALFLKAEAKYHLGNFESALVFYHRGKKVARNKRLDLFIQGIRRTEEAIEEHLDKKSADLFDFQSPAFFDKNILRESYSNLKRLIPKHHDWNI